MVAAKDRRCFCDRTAGVRQTRKEERFGHAARTAEVERTKIEHAQKAPEFVIRYRISFCRIQDRANCRAVILRRLTPIPVQTHSTQKIRRIQRGPRAVQQAP